MRNLQSAGVVLLWLVSAAAGAQQYSIHAETWARPRSGEALLAMPQLRALVNDLERTAGGVIEIRYPGGEEGVLWAQELQAWLVALGISSQRIRTVAGSAVEDSIELVIRRESSDQ